MTRGSHHLQTQGRFASEIMCSSWAQEGGEQDGCGRCGRFQGQDCREENRGSDQESGVGQ